MFWGKIYNLQFSKKENLTNHHQPQRAWAPRPDLIIGLWPLTSEWLKVKTRLGISKHVSSVHRLQDNVTIDIDINLEVFHGNADTVPVHDGPKNGKVKRNILSST